MVAGRKGDGVGVATWIMESGEGASWRAGLANRCRYSQLLADPGTRGHVLRRCWTAPNGSNLGYRGNGGLGLVSVHGNV